MKYFLNEAQRRVSNSTCYHEFSKGKWDENNMVFWGSESLNIHDDLMTALGLDRLILGVVETYDPYGETEINACQWEQICAEAAKRWAAVCLRQSVSYLRGQKKISGKTVYLQYWGYKACIVYNNRKVWYMEDIASFSEYIDDVYMDCKQTLREDIKSFAMARKVIALEESNGILGKSDSIGGE